jgi:hypothetical protein
MITAIELLDRIYEDVVSDFTETDEVVEVLELIDELQNKLENLYHK